MEAVGAEGQWTSLSGVYTAEEADFMALLLNNQLSNVGTTLQNFWPPHHESSPSSTIMNNYYSLEPANSNLCINLSRSPSTTSSTSAYNGGNCFLSVFPTSSSDHLSSNNISQPTTQSIDFFLTGDLETSNHSYPIIYGEHHGDNDDRWSSEENGGGSEAFAPPDQKIIKVCSSDQVSVLLEDNKSSPSDKSSAKRPQNFAKVEVGKRYVKSKKKQKLVPITSKDNINNEDQEEGGNNNGFGGNGHSSSSTTCCSGDESINGGQETSGGDTLSLSPKAPNLALGSDSKARARRGSATDPQSLYARKRRERINERLKILQNLVPNGTKVDISTMLEEAVQYVKFLQLQIKLLSSDELWMYAPIAYNGKDIGLDHLNLSLAKQ